MRRNSPRFPWHFPKELPYRDPTAVDKVVGFRRSAMEDPIDWNGCPLAEKYPTSDMLAEREGLANAASDAKPSQGRGRQTGRT